MFHRFVRNMNGKAVGGPNNLKTIADVENICYLGEITKYFDELITAERKATL